MGNPEDYQASYPEDLKGRLHIARTSEGEPSVEISSVVRSLESILKKHPFSIGIAPRGSRMKGYSVETSDIDLVVFYDSSDIREDEREQALEGFRNEIEEASVPLSADLGLEINITYHDLRDMKSFLLTGNRNDYVHSIALGDLLEVTVGPRVAEYRKAVGVELDKVSEDKREAVIETIVDMLVAREKMKLEGAVARRIPAVAGKENEILEDRRVLWEKRARKLYGLED